VPDGPVETGEQRGVAGSVAATVQVRPLAGRGEHWDPSWQCGSPDPKSASACPGRGGVWGHATSPGWLRFHL